MVIVFVFKNGYELKTRCEQFNVKRGPLGQIVEIEASKVTENKMIYIDFDELLCVYRVLSDEICQQGEEEKCD